MRTPIGFDVEDLDRAIAGKNQQAFRRFVRCSVPRHAGHHTGQNGRADRTMILDSPCASRMRRDTDRRVRERGRRPGLNGWTRTSRFLHRQERGGSSGKRLARIGALTARRPCRGRTPAPRPAPMRLKIAVTLSVTLRAVSRVASMLYGSSGQHRPVVDARRKPAAHTRHPPFHPE